MLGQLADVSIPLSGTEVGKPITGDLEMNPTNRVYSKATGTVAIDGYFGFKEAGSNPFTVPLIGYTDNENFDYNWELKDRTTERNHPTR